MNEWFQAALILLIFVALGWIFENVLVAGLKRLSARTKSDVDDILTHITARPLFFLILLIGAYIAARTVSTLDAYPGIVNGAFSLLAIALAAWLAERVLTFLITRWFKAHRGLSGTPRILNIIVSAAIWLAAIIVALAHFQVEISWPVRKIVRQR